MASGEERGTPSVTLVLVACNGSVTGEHDDAWAPTVEVTQRDGKYVVHAELPGIKPEDVKLEVTDEAVILQGERKCEHEEKRGRRAAHRPHPHCCQPTLLP